MVNNLLGTAWGNQGSNIITGDDLGYDLTLGGNNANENQELSDWEQSLIGDGTSNNEFNQPVQNTLQNNSSDWENSIKGDDNSTNLGNIGVPTDSQEIYAASLEGTNDGSGKSDWETSLEATDENPNPYENAAEIYADSLGIETSSLDDDDDDDDDDNLSYNKSLIKTYEDQFKGSEDDSDDETEGTLDVNGTTGAEDTGEADKEEEEEEEEYQDENYFKSIAPREYDFANLQQPDSLPEMSQGLMGFYNPKLRKQFEGLM